MNMRTHFHFPLDAIYPQVKYVNAESIISNKYSIALGKPYSNRIFNFIEALNEGLTLSQINDKSIAHSLFYNGEKIFNNSCYPQVIVSY